jgi:hypothetical protein
LNINPPFDPKNCKYRFLCEDCRNLTSTRGWWKYIDKKSSKRTTQSRSSTAKLAVDTT